MAGELESSTLEWFKDDMRIPALAKYKITAIPDNGVSILRVADLEMEDSGDYSCIAKNPFGQDRISIKLSVKGESVFGRKRSDIFHLKETKLTMTLIHAVQLRWISEPKGSVNVPVGKPVHVQCSASGQPAARVTWTKLAGENQTTNSRGYGSELRFSAISQHDSGLYECRAGNGVEKDLVSRIRVNVLGK